MGRIRMGAVLAAAVVAVGAMAGPARGAPTALPGGYPFWTLQMNLCNSGVASCYEGGQSIPEAAGVIRQWSPDLVTLNEVCRGDVQNVLYPAMQQAWPGSQVFWAFAPALNESTGNSPYLCTNGDQYGIGLIGHFIGTSGTISTSTGHYPDEDGGIETRAWLCVHAGTQYDACTTHLSKNGATSSEQCGYLMNTVVPAFRTNTEMIVSGDLNLRYGGSPNAQDCVPAGWFRKGDGDVQHVLATNNLRFDFTQRIALRHTDHPGWLVAVDAP
jgi:endonuclease/exonuclease/phosphatase family metal-dependent hydrolase